MPFCHSVSISAGIPSSRYSFGIPTRRPLTFAGHRRFVVRHRQIDAGRIQRIVARHRLQHDRAVAHRARHRPRLIERRRKRDDAPARTPPIGRLDPGDAGNRRRLTNRATGIGARRTKHQPPRDRRRRSARRPARHQRRIRALAPPRIDHRLEVARLVRRPHRELVHVELAQHRRARIEQIARDGRFVRRLEPVENVRARRRLHTLGAEQILDAERECPQAPAPIRPRSACRTPLRPSKQSPASRRRTQFSARAFSIALMCASVSSRRARRPSSSTRRALRRWSIR